MIELVRHIEILLLENDCVVVPGFGGFIAHDMPASWNAEENTFSPPYRTIGFNPQLKMNDGVLVQSYMDSYNTNFSDATKIMEQEVDTLVDTLYKDGIVEIAHVGDLSLSVRGTLVFVPYENKITSPFFYGLDSFEIKELHALQLPAVERVLEPQAPVVRNKKTYEIRISRAIVRNAVAAIAAIVLFFYMSTPVGNTYVEKENYARLLPADLFGKIEPYSLLTTSIGVNNPFKNTTAQAEVSNEPADVADVAHEATIPNTSEEVHQPATEIEQTAPPVTNRYHIIVASVTRKSDAQTWVAKLKANGHDAQLITGDSRIRISIGSYPTRKEANRHIVNVRSMHQYKDAWILIQ